MNARFPGAPPLSRLLRQGGEFEFHFSPRSPYLTAVVRPGGLPALLLSLAGPTEPCPPAKIILHASSLRPRTLHGRRKASRLCACSLPPQGGHGAYSCLRSHTHCKSLAARAVSTRRWTSPDLCSRRQPCR